MATLPVSIQPLRTSEDQILQAFDALVASQTVFHDTNQHVEHMPDRGVTFEFRISAAFDNKPGLNTRPVQVAAPADTPPQAPASDIDAHGYEIETLNNGTHLLAFNKWAAYRPSLLILTTDPSHQQTERLYLDDFASAWTALSSLSTRYLCFYNCGPEGGCSRRHKHVQLVPSPENYPLWPDLPEDTQKLPFAYFRKDLRPDAKVETITESYDEMLRKTRDVLGVPDGYVPHNVVLTRDWLLVIPRTRADYEGVNCNAICMLGMVMLSKEGSIYDRWRRGRGTGPMDIIEWCGLKSPSTSE